MYGRYVFSELFLLFIRTSSTEQSNLTKLGVQACQHNVKMFELLFVSSSCPAQFEIEKISLLVLIVGREIERAIYCIYLYRSNYIFWGLTIIRNVR